MANNKEETTNSKNKCPNLITETIKRKWTIEEGFWVSLEYPKCYCKEMKSKKPVDCCGCIKWCEKNKKGNKGTETESKLVEQIKKVKKQQKLNREKNT